MSQPTDTDAPAASTQPSASPTGPRADTLGDSLGSGTLSGTGSFGGGALMGGAAAASADTKFGGSAASGSFLGIDWDLFHMDGQAGDDYGGAVFNGNFWRMKTDENREAGLDAAGPSVNWELSANEKGFAAQAGAQLAGFGLREGRADNERDDDEIRRLGLSMSLGGGVRLHRSDDDNDNRTEWGVGIDFGPVSYDYKTESLAKAATAGPRMMAEGAAMLIPGYGTLRGVQMAQQLMGYEPTTLRGMAGGLRDRVMGTDEPAAPSSDTSSSNGPYGAFQDIADLYNVPDPAEQPGFFENAQATSDAWASGQSAHPAEPDVWQQVQGVVDQVQDTAGQVADESRPGGLINVYASLLAGRGGE